MTNEPDTPPQGAQVFEAEGLDRSMKAERVFHLLIIPLAGIAATVGLVLFVSALIDAKTTADYKTLALLTVPGGALVAGLCFIALQVRRVTQDIAALAARHKHRTFVLTEDYLEIFVLALEEHEREYYMNMQQLALRLPWSAIKSFQIKMVKYGRERSVRCYVITAEGLPERFEGELKMPAKHFRLNEADVLEALEKHLIAA